MSQVPSWKQALRKSFSKVDKLADFLELSSENRQKLLAQSSFPLLLPFRLASKIAKNDLSDPIFRQFVPIADETLTAQGFTSDPVGEQKDQKTSKLLHKYSSRVLLLPSGNCAMNCRYCFRRAYPYAKHNSDMESELSYIKNTSNLQEVILSGGDPLSLDDRDLADLLHKIDSIPHISKIRFHTRFPVGIPERITMQLLATLESLHSQVIFIIHTNHVNEWDSDLTEKTRQLQKLGIPILTQTVLLKGVNDTKKSLISLFTYLTDHGILPYYLHQLDRVSGSAHFECEDKKGEELIRACRESLPGYAVPTFVKEEHGMPSKTPITSFQQL